MPKRTYRVVYNGVEYTRQTERIYTHIVLVRRDYETELADTIKRARQRVKADHDYAVDLANRPINPYSWITAEQLAEHARIAALTPEQYEQERVEHARAYVEKRRAAGVFDNPGPLTWCGRPDLAAKEEARARSSGYWAEVVTVPVPQP